MTRLFIIIFLLMLQAADGAVPRLFQEKKFTAASFAEAVNHFVALGEDDAVQELKGLAVDDEFNDFKQGFSINERIGWMCRVLFEAKSENLRPPYFGGLDLPYHSMPAKNWPLYPVALSRSTYFVLSEGYSVAGRPEDPKTYIAYCRKTGVFRTKLIKVPTKAQALAAAAALRRSLAWRIIKWEDHGEHGEDWSYTMSETYTWEFIQRQAEAIPL